MRKIIFVITGVFILFSACRKSKFLAFENDTDDLQICIKPFGVLKAINTGENGGQEMLQLFNTNFDLIEEVPLYSTTPFEISKWQDGVVELRFFVDNFDYFGPWFYENKYKPLKIGSHKIKYTYLLIKGGTIPKDVNIDSIFIDKKEVQASFFSNGLLLNKIKVDSLLVFKDRIVNMSFKSRIDMSFYPKNEKLIKKYLEDITDIYDK